MDLNRFKECAVAYGAERRRWPVREHGLYDRLASTPDGAAILAEAERTDRFLDAFEVAEPGEALAQAISTLATSGAHTARNVTRRRFWLPAAAFAASAILGFAIGFAQVHTEGDADLVAQLLLGPASIGGIGL